MDWTPDNRRISESSALGALNRTRPLAPLDSVVAGTAPREQRRRLPHSDLVPRTVVGAAPVDSPSYEERVCNLGESLA